MNIKYLLVFVSFLLVKVLCVVSINDRPIIGIVTEELSENSLTSANSFIMAFYVKFIEAGGARVVPIQIYKSKEYYQDILSKINGVLIPGGGDILNSKGFGRTGKIIFDIAVEMNKKGDYFPIWGTCLGFELMNLVAAKKSWMKICDAEDLATNIKFVNEFNNSRMFANLSIEMKNMMEKENVTIHFHHWCITPQNYSLSGLDKIFKVLALNKDAKGETFISVIEAYKYPFYGVTFHPEKVLFDWEPQNVSIPHSAEAVRVAQYFSNFFISEARKSSHHFPSKSEENSVLIYNYNPIVAGNDPSGQMYEF